jgi:hypothetical protein
LIAFPKMWGTLSPNGDDINLCCFFYKYPIPLLFGGPRKAVLLGWGLIAFSNMHGSLSPNGDDI